MTIVSFHSKAPLYNGGTAQWAADLERISGLMASTTTPLIVAGDFNATNDHRQFRELLMNGYTDSAQDSGTGYLPTYPADGPLGPLAGLDHVLLGSGLLGRHVRSADLPGSDHRAVIVSVGILPSAN
jgi:endonuclease/exonuclease/phosphatase (EEP) superfamily protein YafD